MVTNWPWRRQLGRTRDLPRRRAARRIESYVYGNVLVLAAIITAGTAEVASGRTALIALGTAASTFVAHLLAMSVGHQAEAEAEQEPFREAARDGLPMATSGVLPGIALIAGWFGWLDPDVGWWIAVGIIGVRFLTLGSVVSYLKGEPSTWRNVLIGLGLAVAGLLVAVLKNVLTH
jgi:hypothetical protein